MVKVSEIGTYRQSESGKYLTADIAKNEKLLNQWFTVKNEYQDTFYNYDEQGYKTDESDKIVLEFEEIDYSLILNKTNATTMAKDFGDESNNWKGKKVKFKLQLWNNGKFGIVIKSTAEIEGEGEESPNNPSSTTPKQEHIMDMETVDMSPGVHNPEDLEDKDKVAEEWHKRIHQDFLGQGTNPTRKMMFTELNAMFMDEAKEDDLGLLDKDMAKRVFRLIKESKEYK